MADGFQIIYASQAYPEITPHSSIFLAGPSPRGQIGESWRPEAYRILRDELGYKGHVFSPEAAEGTPFDYDQQIAWEETGLQRADVVVFWIPRTLDKMPAFTTNDEWGCWKRSGKVVFGAPPAAERVRYQKEHAKWNDVSVYDTLIDTLREAVQMCGDGAARAGGEVHVPLYVWRSSAFQQWYQKLTLAGNVLRDAKVKWAFRINPRLRTPAFLWVLAVTVYVTSENRLKTNEVVVGRPDVSAVLMWHRPSGAEPSHTSTEVVLVREFRSAVANISGMVWELPGGSPGEGATASEGAPSALAVAAEEVHEETGLTIAPERMREGGVRQLAATILSHRAALFSVELTAEEIAKIKADQRSGVAHGLAADTERTYVHVVTVSQLLTGEIPVDWSTLGQILSILKN